MKIYDKLDEILKHRSKIKILRFLFAERDEHTGRRIAKGIEMSASSTHRTLQEMKKEGLLDSRKKGNAVLYGLREDNYVVKKLLKPLFDKEKHIYKDIITLIKKSLTSFRADILSMAIFGSLARKEETAKSDIDLLILLKNEGRKAKISKVLDQLYIDMAKKFSVGICPYVLTKKEIRRRYKKKEPLIRAILNENQLIYGEAIERILA